MTIESQLSALTTATTELLQEVQTKKAVLDNAVIAVAEAVPVVMRNIGPSPTAPTVRSNGGALQAGDYYFNTVSNATFVYSGGTWGMVTGATAADLANATDPAKGSAQVGHRRMSLSTALQKTTDEVYASGANIRFWRRVRSLLNGTVTQIPVICTIDSVSGYVWQGLLPMLTATLGSAGSALGPFASGSGGPTFITSGDVIVPNGTSIPFSYAFWPTGIHQDIGSGGSVIFQMNGAVFNGTHFAIYFAKRPGGGQMTVELLDSANNVMDTQSIDTSNSSVDYGKTEFVLGAAAPRKMRVTCTSGRVIVVGPKFINSLVPGIVLVGLNRGGLGLIDVNSAPSQIWQGCVADLNPALGTYFGRENEFTVGTQLTTFLTSYNSAVSQTDWILGGCYAWGGDVNQSDFGLPQNQQPSYLESIAIKSVADAFGYEFFDAYALFDGPLIRKEIPGDVHLSANDVPLISSAFAQHYSFNNRTLGRSFASRYYAGTAFRSSRYETASGDANVLSAGVRRTDAGNRDVYDDFDRTYRMTMLLNGGASPVSWQMIRASTNNPGALFLRAAPAGNFVNVSSYEYDGESVTQMFGGGLIDYVRTSATTVRRRTNPTHSAALTGSGSPAMCFSPTDTAFTDSSDYTANEMRVAFNATSNEFILQVKNPSNGQMRRAVIATTPV